MKKFIVLLLAIVFLFLLILNTANAQSGSLQGKVFDGKMKEGIPFVTVELLQNGILITGTVADLNGNYCIKPIVASKYSLCVISLGYDTVKLAGVEVHADVLSFQDVQMSSSDPTKKATSDGYTEDAWSYPKDNSVIHSSEPVYYYLDGMLIHGRINIPDADVLELRVMGSGLDARYENDVNREINFTLDIPNRGYPTCGMSWHCNY